MNWTSFNILFLFIFSYAPKKHKITEFKNTVNFLRLGYIYIM